MFNFICLLNMFGALGTLGLDMPCRYLEVNDKSSQSVWEYINKPAQWAVDATADRAGINIDLVDLLCGSVGDTVFTPYQAMLPSFPGNPDDSYSFSSVGNTKVMAIQCSAPYDRVAPTCLDSDEIQFLGPSLNWPHIIYFFVGAFLVAQALALGKERVVWQGGISLFFFVAIMLSVVWWAKNQGRTAKYMTGAIGMAGISISKVLAKNTSMLLAVIVQSQYLVGGVVALVLMAFVLAIWFEPERKARDIISDLLLTVVGIIIMAANEPFPHCGVVLGVTLAIAVHLHILVNEVTGVVKKVLLAISNTLYTILWVVTLPFRPVLWALTFIFSLLGISTNLLTSLVSAPPKVWIQPQTVQEYESEGLMNTAMEIENTRVNQIEPNTRLYRRTQRVEEGATSAGALSPAGRVRTDYGLHTQLARARGTSPAAARLWAARRESMPLPAENDITEDELNASMQEYN